VETYWSFDVTESNGEKVRPITGWTVKPCDRTSCEMKPVLEQIGVLYYEVAAAGTA
jgi:hypothetical protein